MVGGTLDGTFLLEWQGALWLVRQQKNACVPIKLPERGRKLDSGILARIKVTGSGMYLGLKNGTFYAIHLQTGETVLRPQSNATFGPATSSGTPSSSKPETNCSGLLCRKSSAADYQLTSPKVSSRLGLVENITTGTPVKRSMQPR